MGGVHKLDLTSDVTHLFVGNPNTPKYRYVARERPDIKVLRPDWVEAVRQAWLEGDDVDLQQLEQQHRLPTLSGLSICITGFAEPDLRKYISDLVEAMGATYHGDLTRGVTHLIAHSPQGAKYDHAKQWGINIVSLKWLEDSVQRGMALDESSYDPGMPVEAQGKGAVRDRVQPRTSLGKRERDGESQLSDETGKRKLRRTASSRLSGHSQDLWQDMSARDNGSKPPEKDQWSDRAGPAETLVADAEVLFAQSETLGGGSPSDADDRAVPAVSERLPRQSGALPHRSEANRLSDRLFTGLFILIHGFDHKQETRLRQFLEPNEACIVGSSEQLQLSLIHISEPTRPY